jgi:hypothetical protein
MTSPVNYLTNGASVTFTKDGTWQSVQLSAQLPAGSKIAILQVVNTQTYNDGIPRSISVQSQGGGQIFSAQLTWDSDCFFAIPCNFDALAVKLQATDSYVDVRVIAGLQGDGVVSHGVPIDKSSLLNAQVGAWFTRNVSFAEPRVAGEIEATIVATVHSTSNVGTWGGRWFGSTQAKLFNGDQWARANWIPVKINPIADEWAFYQLYSSGKNDPDLWSPYTNFYEIGYVLKGYGFHGIENTADESVPASTGWTTRAVSSQVPAGAEGILGPITSTAANRTHGLRPVGGTDPAVPRYGNTGCCSGSARAALNASGQYQYDLRANPEFWVFAYTLPLVDLDPPEADVEFLASGEVVPLAPLAGDVAIEFEASGEVVPLAPLAGDVAIEFEVTGDLRLPGPAPRGAPVALPRIRGRVETGSRVPPSAEVAPEILASPWPSPRAGSDPIAPAGIRARPEVASRISSSGTAASGIVAVRQVVAEIAAETEPRPRFRVGVEIEKQIAAEAEVRPAIRGGVACPQ